MALTKILGSIFDSKDNGLALSVLDYGAKGDGVTDDSASIIAAIADAVDGDTIVFPGTASSYKIGSSIVVAKRIYLEGGGAEVTATAAITMFDLTVEGASINGFKLTGDRTAGQIALGIGQNYVKARNLTIMLVDQGVKVYGGVWQRLEHIRCRNIATKVLEVGNVVGTVVEDFRYDTDTGTYAEPTTGVDLYGEGCNFSDLDFIHAGTCLHVRTNARSSTWNFFNSCSFDTSTYGLRVTNTDAGQTVKGLMFDQCWFSSHSEAGAYLNGNFNTDGMNFKGCVFVNNGKNGLLINEASTNVEVVGCTFAGNSTVVAGTEAHIKHDSIGDVSVLTTHFHDWGGLTGLASAAIERTVGGAFIIIGDCYANGSHNTLGFDDSSASASEIGVNFGILPSPGAGATELNDLTDINAPAPSDNDVLTYDTGTGKWLAEAASGGGLPNSTTESTGNLNITSTDAVFNTIRGEATVQSGVEGTTSAVAAYGGVFSNTGLNGTGLRVNAGDAEFAGDVSVDVNLGVSGTSTLTGAVGGTGFVSAVDTRIVNERQTTAQVTGTINYTSTNGTFNTVRGQASVQSGVEGVTSAVSAYGGVFSNTGGGAGLRVAQGTSQFVGGVTMDSTLAVTSTTTLTGSVVGSGFTTGVDARVSYETLNNKSDVGTGSTQVARGNHTHTKANITDFQNYRMFGIQSTTNGSGVATFNHGFGATPAQGIVNMFGNGANSAGITAFTSTTMSVEVRDVTASGALVTNTSLTFFVIVSEAP